jgi:hypothetical protein
MWVPKQRRVDDACSDCQKRFQLCRQDALWYGTEEYVKKYCIGKYITTLSVASSGRMINEGLI